MVFFVMSINATPAGSPEVRRSATAVKSCRYAFIVCADGLRVARSFRKSANQFGVAAAAPPGAIRGGDRRLVVGEAAGHVPSVTEKRWIITLIHQTCVNRCRTVSFTLHNPGEKRHSDEKIASRGRAAAALHRTGYR